MEAQQVLLTKIIATVGPACQKPEQLARMIEEGARVFRINFSHGSLASHTQTIQAIRTASDWLKEPIGVLGDLSGPKLRVGKTVPRGVPLEVGQRVLLQQQPAVGGQDREEDDLIFSTTMPGVVDEIDVGQRVLIDDGHVRMLVTDKHRLPGNTRLVCNVTAGGVVSTAKGINLPDTAGRTLPALTDHDLKCIDWALEHGVDFLGLSFIRRAQDVRELRRVLESHPRKPQRLPIIAKIEKPQALDDLDAIIEQADVVMVARGDLGVETDVAEVPWIQKRIIKLAHDHGKPVVVATQMLQSMIHSHTPTRAEVSDVANAIYDGADAVMLSAETAVGKYPVQAVRMMARIAASAQSNLSESPLPHQPPRKPRESRYRTAALAHGVAVVVRDLGARLVASWSERGGTARYLSQNRLPVPIITASSNDAALRQMTILFGVVPVVLPRPADSEAFLIQVDELVQKHGWAQRGDPIVSVTGEPIGTAGVTNRLRIHYVGDIIGQEPIVDDVMI